MLSTAFASLLGGLIRGGHGGVQGGELAHHTLVGVLLISMYGLCMLAQIVEARKLLSTMAGKRTFTSVLPVWWMERKVSQGRERDEERKGQGTRT